MTETTQTSATNEDWLIVSSYTRSRALADEVLVGADAAMAREAGWKHPVAYTAAVHGAVIAWSEQTDIDKGTSTAQDQAGREWDVLHMAAHAARRAHPSSDRVAFVVAAVPPTGRGTRAVEVDLVVHIGPGDTPEPVVTIMLPGED